MNTRDYLSPTLLFVLGSLGSVACGGDPKDDGGAYTLSGGTEVGDGDHTGDEDHTGDGNPGDGDGDPGDGDPGDGDPGDGDPGDGDPTDGSTKFDLSPIGDAGDPGGGGFPGPGSCRPSEIYGASGGFPAFTDPAYADFLDRTVALVTHRQHSGGSPNVLTIVDISGDPPPPNMNYFAPLYWQPHWTTTNLGRIFGLTLDSDGNIYVAATTIYGATTSPDKIRRIDGVTGEISDFATLPTTARRSATSTTTASARPSTSATTTTGGSTSST